MQFFISKQWINRFNTFAEPGPISNYDFLCRHGGKNNIVDFANGWLLFGDTTALSGLFLNLLLYYGMTLLVALSLAYGLNYTSSHNCSMTSCDCLQNIALLQHDVVHFTWDWKFKLIATSINTMQFSCDIAQHLTTVG